MITHHHNLSICNCYLHLGSHAVFSLFPLITTSAINFPIYGVQWHPEKSIYEWTSAEGINHSEHAVIVAQTLANFFVQEARKSAHSFPSTEEENSMLIYNYSPHDSFTTFEMSPLYFSTLEMYPLYFFYC